MITLANGKSAGPDSLPNEFYKCYAAMLAQPLTEVFNEALECEQLPDCMKKGNISVLYKKKIDAICATTDRSLSSTVITKYSLDCSAGE